MFDLKSIFKQKSQKPKPLCYKAAAYFKIVIHMLHLQQKLAAKTEKKN